MKFRVLITFLLGMSVTQVAAAAGTRTVKDVEGQTVEVPEQAKRVVALSEIDLDSCLALGVKPVGTVNGRGQTSYPHYLQTSPAAELARDVPIVGDIGRPNMEALVKLKPDLILTSPTRPEVLVLLRKIAPTVVTYKSGDEWKVVFTRVADALGQKAKADDFMTSYRKELDSAKAKLATVKDKSVSIVRWNPKGPAFMYRDAFASLVLRDMGFDRPQAQKVPGERHSMPLSLEALNDIDAGWLFVGTLEPRGDATEAMQEIAKSSAFQRLGAVKAKHYFPVDGSKWTSAGGPLAALSIVKETTEMISAAK